MLDQGRAVCASLPSSAVAHWRITGRCLVFTSPGVLVSRAEGSQGGSLFAYKLMNFNPLWWTVEPQEHPWETKKRLRYQIHIILTLKQAPKCCVKVWWVSVFATKARATLGRNSSQIPCNPWAFPCTWSWGAAFLPWGAPGPSLPGLSQVSSSGGSTGRVLTASLHACPYSRPSWEPPGWRRTGDLPLFAVSAESRGLEFPSPPSPPNCPEPHPQPRWSCLCSFAGGPSAWWSLQENRAGVGTEQRGGT